MATLDFCSIALSFIAFFIAARGRLDFSVWPESPFITATAVVSNVTLLYATGAYRSDALVDRDFTISRLPIALGLAGLITFAILHYGLNFVLPADALYRSVGRSSIIALIGVGISLCATLVARVLFHALTRQGLFRRRVLVIGAGKRALHLYDMISQSSRRLTSDLIFIPGTVIGGAAETLIPHAVATAQEPIDVITSRLGVDEIVVALDDCRGVSLERLLACKTRGIPVTDMQSFIERETGRVDLSALESSWLLYSDSFGMGMLDIALKRLLDIGVSLILLLISLPVLLVAVAAIALEGHGKVFFRQKRVTRNGQAFWLYKLRTMFADAEKKGPRWAEANDPRITPVGRILRKFRIDEVPQLLNVLRGDMSLVGPRPERPVFVEELSREMPIYDLRHTVKAGLTGWAQINYRYGSSTADARRKLEYDLHYVKNYHLLKDVSIIVQTLRVLLWTDGAR